MNRIALLKRDVVADGRLASSAVPPRATSPFARRSSARRKPQPFPETPFLDSPGAPLNGLRCFTAPRPLPPGYGLPDFQNHGVNP